ncbi:tripartite tricarboxylate transporter TctB family protein [Sporosarcina pasteurii]|uniref:Tripartite tricarboxylate transporter TctB family n=1 Tax=Sporosarcina pasteurii TaxID=1474 RepID=A0A380BET9_SPOPA|nr:tripartite tricarboxylate transporter TctB family protein [Sporosarcina pasteurii]MDS9472615.1 tripartite tricarboxylate transporter TctB family protein [Sporosarcina pasteurii]QBQ06161.1 tripartite tricarboxylate transporter TctB family protein [Sporosarcina pasteurii]SUI99296.1 Tripartite tricarboxylate transporter TctB family [Sporosarcina pasteurii]
MLRFATPIFFMIVGFIYLIATLNLPKARLGDPNGPMYFPIIIAVLIIVSSAVYFFQEWKLRKEEFKEFQLIKEGRAPLYLIATIVLMLIYTFLFERIGFLYATMLFLGGLMFLLNGRKRWIYNIIIAVAFSFITWYAFAELLQVSLP